MDIDLWGFQGSDPISCCNITSPRIAAFALIHTDQMRTERESSSASIPEDQKLSQLENAAARS
jgi:hypothetical protein